MNHYAPHSRAKFEGYYTRFHLPSGASLIFILCSVKTKGHYFTLTHVPGDHDKSIYQQELLLDDAIFQHRPGSLDFRMVGRMPSWSIDMCAKNGRLNYTASHSMDLDFTASTWDPTFWSASSSRSSPEGAFAYLPLPLHWHVLSLESRCKLRCILPPEAGQDPRDINTAEAVAHEEKNWSDGFPSAHMWLQARSPLASPGNAKSICLAGGKILGMEAFLVGYRNEQLGLEIDFKPPFALRFLGIAPFMGFDIDWENRRFEMQIQGFWNKLQITGSAPKNSFFNLSAPTPEGFKENLMAESLSAHVTVTVCQRNGLPFGKWETVSVDHFERAGLEFGGEYYPLRGAPQKND